MCFSVNVNLIKEELENRFGATFLDPEKYRPSYYYHAFAFPALPAICSDKQEVIRFLNWGLIPSWVNSITEAGNIKSKTFNARAESLSTKPSFSGPFESKRCLIPVKGFYEWQHVEGRKIPWYIYRADNEIITLAGLWDEWVNNDTGDKYDTFSIVTTEANSLMEKIHNTAKRMPAILDRITERQWLDLSLSGEKAKTMLIPCQDEILQAHTIGNLINSKSENRNSPDIIKPYNRPFEGTLFS